MDNMREDFLQEVVNRLSVLEGKVESLQKAVVLLKNRLSEAQVEDPEEMPDNFSAAPGGISEVLEDLPEGPSGRFAADDDLSDPIDLAIEAELEPVAAPEPVHEPVAALAPAKPEPLPGPTEPKPVSAPAGPSHSPSEPAFPPSEPAPVRPVHSPVEPAPVKPAHSPSEPVPAPVESAPSKVPEPSSGSIDSLFGDPNPQVQPSDRTPSPALLHQSRKTKAVMDVMADKTAWLHDMPGQEIKSLRSAIGLGDQVMFIKRLFRDDSALYQDSIEKLNSMSTLDEALKFIGSTFPEWNMDSDDVYRFMMAVRRRIRK